MKIGIQLPEVEWEVPFPEYLAMGRVAEAAGFDSLWVGDHLLYDLPTGPRGPWEAWTTLAAIAAVTDRVEIGPLVASTSFHAPPMLAKQAATVDAISQGRLIVGLGAGWNRREYDAFGFAYDRRVSRFEEAFTIIRSLLRDGEIDFHGEYYDAERCVLHPRSPRPGGPPLMVGSIGPRMLGITLPHVDAWNVWWSDYGNTPERFAAQKAKVDELAWSVGRNPGHPHGNVCDPCPARRWRRTSDGQLRRRRSHRTAHRLTHRDRRTAGRVRRCWRKPCSTRRRPNQPHLDRMAR